jgi:hypothetical protein
LRFEGGADAEGVVEDDGAEVGDAAWERLQPAGGALELVGCADVEHEVPVEDGDDFGGRDVLGQELAVFWFGAAVAGNEDVEALVGGDEAEAGGG